MKTQMITRFFVLGVLFTAIVGFSSCTKCKSCEGAAVAQTIVDDSIWANAESTVSAIEYCGDELDMLEANPEVVQETSQEFGGITQKIVTTTTWTCQ